MNETCVLFFGDPFEEIKEGNRFGVLLNLDSEEEIDRLYKDLLEDRKPLMELKKTFWGALFAVVKDHYGVTLSLNYTLG